MSFKVFWCARDLNGVAWGNHHFILIYLSPVYGLPPLTVLAEKGVRFVTLGGFKVGANLEFKANEASDVKSVREGLNPSKRSWWRADYDIERHRVPSPLSSDQQFAVKLVQQAQAYKVNTQTKPVKYSLANENCAAWVNTMFKVAGVKKAARTNHGEFFGIDWGEEDLIDESLFK